MACFESEVNWERYLSACNNRSEKQAAGPLIRGQDEKHPGLVGPEWAGEAGHITGVLCFFFFFCLYGMPELQPFHQAAFQNWLAHLLGIGLVLEK